MAIYMNEPSRTFGEYLLIPGYSSTKCIPANVSLKTPLVKYAQGEEPSLSLNIPMTSAIMQSVSDDNMAIALAREGGLSFIFGSQSIESQAQMVSRVKNYRAGFVISDSNITPENTLADILELKERTGHSTVAVTSDGTSMGKLLGIVTSRDYRVSRMTLDTKVADFMTSFEHLICADESTTLKEANDIIWEHKLNSLPIIDKEQRLVSMVFRKDYNSHKTNENELIDSSKRYMVGAGINTRDYAERIPALLEAGADVLCIDSSEGFSEWQKIVLDYVRENYGDTVKVGAGNVVDSEGFRFLAEAGADNDAVAGVQRAVLNQQRDDRSAALVKLRFNNRTGRVALRVGFQLAHFRNDLNRFQNILDAVALLRRTLDEDRIAAPFFRQ